MGGKGGYGKWLLRRQRPCCLRSDSSLYIRCPPSLPPRSSSNSIPTREFPPPHHPPIIHLSLHSSLFPPTNGNDNTQQPTVHCLSFLQPHIQISATQGDGSFNQTSQVSPSGGKRYVWITQRMQLAGFGVASPSCLPVDSAQCWPTCINTSIQCHGQSWFCITSDYSNTLRQPADSQ